MLPKENQINEHKDVSQKPQQCVSRTPHPPPPPHKKKKKKKKKKRIAICLKIVLFAQEKSTRTSSIVQIIFSFSSFEISEGILRNRVRFIFEPTFNIFGHIWIIPVFVSTTKISHSLWLHVAKSIGSLKRLK